MKKVYVQSDAERAVPDMIQPMGEERVYARYWIESAFEPEQAAEVMAGEQSTGTFIKVPGETAELREAHAATIEQIVALDAVDTPSLPGAAKPRTTPPVYHRAEATLSWPISNMGPSLPNLMATVAGNLFELKPFSGLKLLDVTLSPAFLSRYSGPQFGVAGTRRLCGVASAPLIGTIIKPSVGLTPRATAELVDALVESGIDFIKDDELQADGPHCPFRERLDEVMKVIRKSADKRGRKVMYAFNLTGEIDEMLRRHDEVLAQEGTCVMVSMNSIGLPAMNALRKHSQLPIHGHRNGWGIYDRSPAIGMSYVAYQKFWRLAGVDHMHVNGLDNKFCEANESVIASAKECLRPMFAPPLAGCQIMPVFSSGQTVRQAPATFAALGSTDLIFACGGGLMGHPHGIGAGVRSLQQAWVAAVTGIPLDQHAKQNPELAASLERFSA